MTCLQMSDYWALMHSFSSEWQHVLTLLASSYRPTWKASVWLQKQQSASRGQRKCISPSIMYFLEELIECHPVIVNSRILYQHRLFLLPRRLQHNCLVFLHDNLHCLEDAAILKLLSFLSSNIKTLDDWGKCLYFRIRDSFTAKMRPSSHLVDEQLNNSMKTCTTISKSVFAEWIRRSRTFGSETVDSSQQNINSGKLFPDIPFDGKFCKDTTASSSLDYPETINNKGTTVSKKHQNDKDTPSPSVNFTNENNCQNPFSDQIETEDLGEENENSPLPKKRKIEEAPKEDIKTGSCDEIFDNDYKSDKSSDQPFDDEMLKRVSSLKELLMKTYDDEAAKREILLFTAIPCEHVAKLCSLLTLKNLNESQHCFFIKCISSTGNDLSSSVLEELLSNSIVPYLRTLSSSVSRYLFSLLINALKTFPKPFIDGVLVPVMLTAGFGPSHEDFICKLIREEGLSASNITHLMYRFSQLSTTGELQYPSTVSENLVATLHLMFEKSIAFNPEVIFGILTLLEKYSNHLSKSLKLIKLILLLIKIYGKDLHPYVGKISNILCQNKTFLKKSAQTALQKISCV